MFTDRRPLGLKTVVFLVVVNCLFTVTHFVLIGRGILNTPGLVESFWVFATAVTLIAVLPAAIGAYGLYHKKMWGLGFFTLGSGAYLSSSAMILLLSVRTGTFGIMFYAAIYLILYNFLADVYIWALRHHFRDF